MALRVVDGKKKNEDKAEFDLPQSRCGVLRRG